MLSAQALEAQGIPSEIAKAMAGVVNAPAPPPPGGGPTPTTPSAPFNPSGTGSAAAATQGTTTSGPATTGQMGSLNVPPNEVGGGAGPGSGGGGGGGAGGTGGTTGPPLDWHAYLSDWGFSQDVINELDRIFKTYTDPSQAQAAALAYIRGTDWYKTTFPGIQTGEKLGLFSDEAGYRSYVNQANGQFQNYLGRNVTTNELLDYLNSGRDTSYIGNHLQGQALLASQRPDINYELGAFDTQPPPSDSDLSQYGDYLGGIGNMIGPQINQRIQKAQARLADIFQGTLANPSLSMASGKLVGTSLGNATGVQANKTPDIPS